MKQPNAGLIRHIAWHHFLITSLQIQTTHAFVDLILVATGWNHIFRDSPVAAPIVNAGNINNSQPLAKSTTRYFYPNLLNVWLLQRFRINRREETIHALQLLSGA